MKAFLLSSFNFTKGRHIRYKKPIITDAKKWMDAKTAFLKGIYHFDKIEVINTRPGGYVLSCNRTANGRLKAMEIHFYLQPVNVDGKTITPIHES